MLNKTFGIISWFPDIEPARSQRIERFNHLLLDLKRIFKDIPIMVVAQNWKDYKPIYPITTFSYDRLGILTARKTLRKHFLESSFDYLIMLDDDGMIQCKDGSTYLKEIDDHPNSYGLFRHNNCPLMLLAISKYIYNQIDMPNIDPEQSQGFEDDTFVASLISMFPDSGWDFSHETIEENSFKYNGPGAVPSTWARAKHYDWKAMLSNTQNYINSLDNNKIDLVVPYVDSMDPKWQELYNKYNIDKENLKEETNALCRFRGQGDFFKYFFRCIAQNVPWINNIYLIVQSDSQVPKWLNRNMVKIVYHEDFIPKEYLPTFNSTTIEMFIPFIKGLSNKFLYANDDDFILRPLTSGLFYYGNKVRANTITGTKLDTMYGQHTLNDYCLIWNKNKEEIFKIGNCPRVQHAVRPYLKSLMLECFNLHKEDILKSISKFRETKNYNIYIYDHYFIKTNNQYFREKIETAMISSNTINDTTIIAIFNSPNINMLCIQDNNDTTNIYDNQSLNYFFRIIFKNKCKYEL